MFHNEVAYQSLEALGQAIYTHKKLAERADKASDAVDYLVEKGVFSADEDSRAGKHS